MIESISYSGFKDIYVMGDHGGGQAQIQEAVKEMDAKLSPKGVHVYYINDFHQKTHDDVDMYMYEHKLPIAGHGAMMETLGDVVRGTGARMYVRPIYKTVPFNATGRRRAVEGRARCARRAAGRHGGRQPPRPRPVAPRAARSGSERASTCGQRPHWRPAPSTKEIGKVVFEIGVNNTVAEIKKQTAQRRGSQD